MLLNAAPNPNLNILPAEFMDPIGRKAGVVTCPAAGMGVVAE